MEEQILQLKNENRILKERVELIENFVADFVYSDRYIFQRNIQIQDGRYFQFALGEGTKFGTSVNQKIGFWAQTPVIQPTNAAQAAVSLDTDVTGADTVDKAAINTNFSNIQTLLNRLRADLVTIGLIKGS